jgi:hypothetical protein
MELRLTEAEHGLLVQVLEERQVHFLHEIAKTDHHEFKHSLQRRCELLERILEKLKSHAPVAI